MGEKIKVFSLVRKLEVVSWKRWILDWDFIYTKGRNTTDRRKDDNSDLNGKVSEGERRDGKLSILTRAEDLWEEGRIK